MSNSEHTVGLQIVNVFERPRRKAPPLAFSTKNIGGLVESNLHNRQWYALQIRPRLEKLAARHLNDKGYEGYLPVYTARRRWSDRMKSLEVPLFPGYTFCRFDIQERLPILVSPGVLSIVGTGKTPTAVSDREIFSIQQLIASGLLCGPWPFVQVGESVSVERGPLAGLEGIVIEVKSSLRLILSVPLLQRSVAVEIDRDCVRKENHDHTRRIGLGQNSALMGRQ